MEWAIRERGGSSPKAKYVIIKLDIVVLLLFLNKINNIEFMSKKLIILSSLAFILAPQLAQANVLMPLSLVILPVFPVIIFVEGLTFWLLAKKMTGPKTGFWKSVLIVLIANFITSLIGAFTSGLAYGVEVSLWIVIAFITSVLAEWAIYISLFKLIPFLKSISIKNKQLLMISFVANIVTYLPMLIFLGSG